MAHIVNIETSDFTNAAIQIHQQNRVGQYSKFLDRTPIFVTYYHISTTQSRVDVGTGGIEHELGERSPIRFVKITEFPIYNIPEQFKPETIYDESGTDIELTLNGIVLLPNTIDPLPGDYFKISLPNCPACLFRVNKPEYNTIQSNDFHEIDADLKDIGDDAEKVLKIEQQVVAEYKTIFEKIGTDDHCFIQTTDIDKVNAIANAIKKLNRLYAGAYYNRECNAFLFPTGVNSEGKQSFLWDPYLSEFINQSEIYIDENNKRVLHVTPCDIIPDMFEYTYSRTIYQALLDRDVTMLCANIYSFINPIQKTYSPIILYGFYGDTVELMLGPSEVLESTEENSNNKQTTPVWFDISKLPCCGPVWTIGTQNQYFSANFIKQLLGCDIETENILELIIFNYMHKITTPISIKELLKSIDINSIQTFYYLPMVIYILAMWYGEYFKADNSLS